MDIQKIIIPVDLKISIQAIKIGRNGAVEYGVCIEQNLMWK